MHKTDINLLVVFLQTVSHFMNLCARNSLTRKPEHLVNAGVCLDKKQQSLLMAFLSRRSAFCLHRKLKNMQIITLFNCQ